MVCVDIPVDSEEDPDEDGIAEPDEVPWDVETVAVLSPEVEGFDVEKPDETLPEVVGFDEGEDDCVRYAVEHSIVV